jgi:hypothetical protein
MVFLLLLSLLMAQAGAACWAAEEGAVRESPSADQPAKPTPVDKEKATIGVRVSVSDNQNAELYYKYELYGTVNLPWAWRTQSGWRLTLSIDLTAAALNGGPDWGFLGSLGHSFFLLKEQWRLAFDCGFGPAYLSRDHFGNEDDLSGHFQFLTHFGLTYLIRHNLSIGYQYQHMSNANIQLPNPGINFHTLQVSYLLW